jgi:oligopeptide/dipeptide ABC transporter ATP-binding protein
MTPLLEIQDLQVTLRLDGEPRPVIHDLSLSLDPGEALAIVGESGAGKSMLLRAIMRMLPGGASATGVLRFDGRDLAGLDETELRRFRADDIGVIFQDPRAHVNPVRRVGDFLVEPLVRLRGIKPDAARRKVGSILADIGISDVERRFRQYPHELSGGLLQRMMIAAAVAMQPRLILADEPTTALDATTQSDVMAILSALRASHGLGMLLVTHDLDLGAAVCDRMAVMYAGTIVEAGAAERMIRDPLHPYTAALELSRPGLAPPGTPLRAIGGQPLSALEAPPGCPFAPRCEFAQPRCREGKLALRPLESGQVACVRAEELRGSLMVAPAVESPRA